MAGMNLTVYAIDGVVPVVDPTAFVHPSAVLIGDVIVGPGCYIGPAACLRGDFGHIEVRAGANIQVAPPCRSPLTRNSIMEPGSADVASTRRRSGSPTRLRQVGAGRAED